MFHGKISIEQSILEIYPGLVTQFFRTNKDLFRYQGRNKMCVLGVRVHTVRKSGSFRLI